MSAAKSSPGMPAAAARLFIRREYAAIKGQRSSVFWALYAILLCSLLAIVFGKAALDHLRERMEDHIYPRGVIGYILFPNTYPPGGGRPKSGSGDPCSPNGAFL